MTIEYAQFAEWREFGENLSRFASIREKAESPQDRIMVQNKGGIQKLIAGDYGKTIIVTVGPTNQADGAAVVSARFMLTTLKTLKGKGQAEIRVTDDGLQMQTSFGSTIKMKNMDRPKYLTPKPYVPGELEIPFDAGFLPDASKYLVTTAEQAPFNQVLGECRGLGFTLRATDDHMMAEVGPLMAEDIFTLHFPDHIFPALKGFEDAGFIYVPERIPPQVAQAQFKAGKYHAVCVMYPNYGKFPRLASQAYTAVITGDKKLLIDSFKSLAGRHAYHRVIMEAKDGKFTIRSGDDGTAEVNVECTGTGTLPVNATFMAKVLSTVDGKTATISYSDSPSLVQVVGDKNDWTIAVSPMK